VLSLLHPPSGYRVFLGGTAENIGIPDSANHLPIIYTGDKGWTLWIKSEFIFTDLVQLAHLSLQCAGNCWQFAGHGHSIATMI
jgi:hypothetical protein